MTRRLARPWLWAAAGCALLAFIGYFISSQIRAPAEAGVSEVAGLEPSNVEILSHSDYYDSLGFLHVVGEVANNGPAPVSAVDIIATFYDENDRVVTVRAVRTASDVIPANKRMPFDIMLHNPLEVFRYELAVRGGQEPATALTGLKIIDNYSELNHWGFLYALYVQGQLQNNTGHSVRFVKIIVTMYDENEQVVGTSFAYATPNRLSPGEVTSFKVITSLPRPIVSFKLHVAGEQEE